MFATAATAAQDGLAKAASTDSPVCRFYIPPQHGDSHFFSASPAECDLVLQRSATDLTTGACPANTHPVFRLWNQRADSNRRYTDVPAIKAQMIAKGYVAEGYAPTRSSCAHRISSTGHPYAKRADCIDCAVDVCI